MYHISPYIAHTRVIFRLHVMRSTLYICENAPPTRHDRYPYSTSIPKVPENVCYCEAVCGERCLTYFSPPSFVRFLLLFYRQICDSLHVQWLLLYPQVHWKYYQSASSTRKVFNQWETKICKIFKIIFVRFFFPSIGKGWTKIRSTYK